MHNYPGETPPGSEYALKEVNLVSLAEGENISSAILNLKCRIICHEFVAIVKP